VSTSPLRGVKGGGLGLKSTKEFTRFRVLERPGSTVGVADIEQVKTKYPFHVDCTRTTQLFELAVKDLRSAIDAMASDDADKCKAVLQKEHKVHVDGLKYDGANEVALSPAASMAKGACKDVAALQTRVASVHGMLRDTRGTTIAIPALVKQLGGSYMPHLSPRQQQQARDALHAEQAVQRSERATRAAARTSVVAPPSTTGPERGGKQKDAAAQEADELEERTHYAALSNFNVAAMARVVS